MSAVGRRETAPGQTTHSSLQAELDRAAASFDDADLRVRLLEVEMQAAEAQREIAATRLSHLNELAAAQGVPQVRRSNVVSQPTSRVRQAPRSDHELSGAKLREAAIQSVLRRGEVDRPIHHAEWLAWLRADGCEPAGKKPENVFLTQIGRSPLVQRTDEAGFYVVTPARIGELQAAIRALDEQIAALPAPDQMSMLGDERQRRQALQAEMGRTERQLQEAWRMLSLTAPPGAEPGEDEDEDWPVRAWITA